ncbi:tachykinin-like peptides receptor 86C [Glossina fuscipes]|uniref:Tachykinin-like peptides receptor 86C n=2 Tax=Nemorhina TaxID=44051 RepID=A0A9C5Z7H2_9MUSC|nr:tachykinin-like peptides receptor 86C [Glossina fuscipes]
MSENVDTNLLINCTILSVKRFHLYSLINASRLREINHTDTFSLLSHIIENRDNLENFNDARDFLTECLFPSPTRPYELPWEQKTMWAIVFGIMLLVAITGNCIVLWIVTGHRSMRTVTNYFLLNLSIADLLMSSLNCIFNFIFMLNSDWPFGAFYCTVNNFMANVTVSTSVFTLVAISFDRYIAIVHPLKRRTSRRKVRFILILIWFFSAALSSPCLFYSSTMTKRYYNGKSRTVCYMLWPDGRYPTSMSDYVYNIIILIITYGIPMIVMLICYTLMGRVLWGSRSIGETTDRQLESIKSKRKVVRMFIAIVAIFAICWLPYHMFFIYAYHNNRMTSTKYVQHMYLAFYWLAMSNAMVNPVIYYWMNKRFRLYFQKAICCFCLNSNKIKIDSPHSRMMNYNKNSSQRFTKTDNKLLWKRSTIETQIQVVNNTAASLREKHKLEQKQQRQQQHQQQQYQSSVSHGDNSSFKRVIIDNTATTNKAPTQLQTDAPLCLTLQSNGKQQRVKITYITCDEDNNPLEVT